MKSRMLETVDRHLRSLIQAYGRCPYYFLSVERYASWDEYEALADQIQSAMPNALVLRDEYNPVYPVRPMVVAARNENDAVALVLYLPKGFIQVTYKELVTV